MSIISQKTWDNMPKEEKENICKIYKGLSPLTDEATAVKIEYEVLFGKENLRHRIRTWVDVLNQTDIHDFVINHPNCDNKLKLKLEAVYKIHHLIELGYGGVVTDEEWKNNNRRKYVISYYPQDKRKFVGADYCIGEISFLAFHTCQQREEFMSYPENRALVEQYYLYGNN